MVTLGQSALREVDLLIALGADFSRSLRYRQGRPPAPVDLTGWRARAQIRERPRTDPWATLTDRNGITLGADGIIGLTITHQQMTGWDAYAGGRWDLLLISPSGQRIRAVEGRVTLSRGITAGG